MPSSLPLLLLLSNTGEPAPLDDLYEPPIMEVGVFMDCESDADCRIYPDYPLCDPKFQECVECLDDTDCDPGWTCSTGGRCYDSCATDDDCDGVGGASTCDTELGTCVGCLESSDCAEAEYCMDQGCLPDHCTPGETFCFESTVMLCLDDGGSTMVQQECALGCEDTETGAVCTSDGGNDTSGGPASDSGPTTEPPVTSSATTSDPDGTGDTTPADEAPIRDGCACTTTNTPAPFGAGAWPWLLGVVVLRRRSRRARARRPSSA